MKFLDEHNITGRGVVLAYEYDEDDKDFKVGQKWLYKNKYWLITGVEGATLLVYPPRRSPHVGIVVREISEEEYNE